VNDIDLNEYNDSNSEDGEDYVDLSTMLDGPAPPPSDDDDSEEDGSNTASGSEESDALSISEDEDNAEAVDKLQSLIASLPQSSKRSLEGDSTVAAKKRRKIMPEQTEAWDENQFASTGMKSACMFYITPVLTLLV